MSSEHYNACPYCLTQVSGQPVAVIEVPKPEKASAVEDDASNKEANTTPAGCRNHFGYLSERASNVPIPDDCLTCRDIVQCMLKKAKDQVGP